MSSWDRRSNFRAPSRLSSYPKISIVIAARNEANHIQKCLNSIVASDYPQEAYEIILVDDHSTDRTLALAQDLHIDNIKILQQNRTCHGKKAAISLAIENANYDWIISVDADGHFGSEWLKSFASYIIYQDVVFITGLVSFENEERFLDFFQSMDLMGTMAVTLNGIDTGQYHMANGANLCFQKSAFEAVKGFEGNEHIASGDDMFLIQKMAEAYPGKIRFLKSKDAICVTKKEDSWSNLLHQRIRWASKSKAYTEIGMKKMLILIFLLNFSIFINLLLVPFFGSFTLFILLMQLLCKWSVDYLFLYRIAHFFNKTFFMKWFLVLAPLHVLHILFSGVYGLFSIKTKWKGRPI